MKIVRISNQWRARSNTAVQRMSFNWSQPHSAQLRGSAANPSGFFACKTLRPPPSTSTCHEVWVGGRTFMFRVAHPSLPPHPHLQWDGVHETLAKSVIMGLIQVRGVSKEKRDWYVLQTQAASQSNTYLSPVHNRQKGFIYIHIKMLMRFCERQRRKFWWFLGLFHDCGGDKKVLFLGNFLYWRVVFPRSTRSSAYVWLCAVNLWIPIIPSKQLYATICGKNRLFLGGMGVYRDFPGKSSPKSGGNGSSVEEGPPFCHTP